MTIGTSQNHDSAELHVTGRALYTDDISLPSDALHLTFGLASIAHGSIETLDLGEVKASKGVVAVLTASDLKYANDTSPSAHDEPLLSDEKIHYFGQPIFIVIAQSHLLSRKAAKKAKISYTIHKPILTIEDALNAKSYFEKGPRQYSKGNAQAAVESAAFQLEDSFVVGGQEHFYLEGQVAFAIPQDDTGMVVLSSSQHPTEVQHKVAEALGVEMNQVRVEVRRMGGAFGGKESQGNALAVACAVAAQRTKKTCKMRYDRDDDMIITGKRHDFNISYNVGFNKLGRILGITFQHFVRCGWSQDLSLPVADRAMLHADNAYNLTNVDITSHRLRTNTQSNTAFRGFGGPQGIIGIERALDHIAHFLNLDPLDIRKQNFYTSYPIKKSNDIQTNVNAETTPYGMEVTDSITSELVEKLLDTSNYSLRRKDIIKWNEQNPLIKKGIALSPVKFGISFTLSHFNQAGALVHVYKDGSIYINHGGTEMGQGLLTKTAQIAAEIFGVSLSRIKISATDTAKIPNTSATAASSGTDLNGMAIAVACNKIKKRIESFLLNVKDTSTDQIEFRDNKIFIDTKSIKFSEVIALAYEKRIALSATGFYATPELSWDRKAGKGRPFYYFSYGAAVTEVTLDKLTGENRILRADILHDCGHSLNPALDMGQIEGGYVQGAGWLTMEELVWNKEGALQTHAPSTYKIPCASDRPETLKINLWDAKNRSDTIYRSKAVGEPPLILGISAWLALSNAVAACGKNYPHLNAPATPEQILFSIQRAESGF